MERRGACSGQTVESGGGSSGSWSSSRSSNHLRRTLILTLPRPSPQCLPRALRFCPAPAPPAPAGVLPESWGALSVLQGLDLSNNKITGDLPNAWGSMTNLQVGG